MSFKYSYSFLDGVKHGDSVSFQFFSVLTYQFFSNDCDESFNVFDEFLNDFKGNVFSSLESFLHPLTH
jgi:hypothetical protein